MPTVVKKDAAELAKKYIFDHGIKQSWIADSMGISKPVLSGRLNGRYKFSADFALSLAKVLNVSADIFLK